MNDNLKFPVLQFYSGLTGLTNESVRNLITGFDFGYKEESRLCLLAFLNCIFEAQIHDQLFFEQMVRTLNSEVNLFSLSLLSPMDCLSVHYFLSSIRTVVTGQIEVDLSDCSIDDQCLGMLLGISTEHAETSCTSSALESVETLNVQYNEYTDTGIAYIARALISNSTLKTLRVGNDSVTDTGLVPLLEALPRLHSLKELVLRWSLSHGDKTLNKIGECVARSTLKQLQLLPYSLSLQSEEAVKEWVQCVVVGGNSLIHSLEHCQVTKLIINNTISCQINRYDVKTQLDSLLQKAMDSINLRRVKKSLHSIDLFVFVR